jgi:hypothetical protein
MVPQDAVSPIGKREVFGDEVAFDAAEPALRTRSALRRTLPIFSDAYLR